MNEKAINVVITNFAIENANLKVAVATLQAELDEFKNVELEETETKKEEVK